AVSALRAEVAARLPDTSWLVDACGLSADAAAQLGAYVGATEAALGTVPTTGCVVAERFFDEAGGMQLVVHAPFGGRINRAWGLALRKRFCVTFNFELQAAATDDGLVISLGEQHSFPLDSVFAEVLARIGRGEVATRAIDTAAPSPMSHEILNSNPYTYLDDAPLEERRARAVALRRTDPDLAAGLGALDPAAIAEVRAQAWPDV